jgi:hypothetical protein
LFFNNWEEVKVLPEGQVMARAIVGAAGEMG